MSSRRRALSVLCWLAIAVLLVRIAVGGAVEDIAAAPSAAGALAVVIGLALPYSVRFLTEYRIPISGLSAIVAIVVSSLVGVLFGTVPAARASKLDPVESLRYE
jgi:ABC-type lipoprotein release transport system permease subunit